MSNLIIWNKLIKDNTSPLDINLNRVRVSKTLSSNSLTEIDIYHPDSRISFVRILVLDNEDKFFMKILKRKNLEYREKNYNITSEYFLETDETLFVLKYGRDFTDNNILDMFDDETKQEILECFKWHQKSQFLNS